MVDIYGFIYITTNNINKRKYIGQKKIDDRGVWKTYLGSGKAFETALKKYGKENFTREIVSYAKNSNELDELEEYWIDKLDAVNSSEYYNLVCGGGTVAGLRHSKETKAIMRVKNIGKNNPMYGKRLYKDKNGFYMKKHSEEAKKKMSESHKGKDPWNKDKTNIYTKETLKKMSVAKLGKPLSESHKIAIQKAQSGINHPMYGKRHSEETKEKIRRKLLGKTSPLKGTKRPKEFGLKISESNKGKGTKKVICVTTDIIFNSIKDAGEYYNCRPSDIVQCCKGKRRSCGKLQDGKKLTWKYYE